MAADRALSEDHHASGKELALDVMLIGICW